MGAERLVRNNGLMLSPHVDHLFDNGYISFDDSGRMMISSALEEDLIRKSKLQQSDPVKPFSN